MNGQAATETFGIARRSFTHIIEALRARPEVERAVLFGSRALGTARPGSDIDLAIFGSNVTTHTARELSREVNERLPIPYKVDVVAYPVVEHENLKHHIDTHGREVYRRNSYG